MPAILAMFFCFYTYFLTRKRPLQQILCKICNLDVSSNFPFQGLAHLIIRWLATRTSESSYFQSARFGWRCILQFRRCSTFRRALTRKRFSHLGVHPRKPNMEPEVVPPYKKRTFTKNHFFGFHVGFQGVHPKSSQNPETRVWSYCQFQEPHLEDTASRIQESVDI